MKLRRLVLGSLATSLIASAIFTNATRRATASEPAALYITICLWSEAGHVSRTRETAVCNEVRLTPGAAGPVFVSMKTCQSGQAQAMRNWFAELGPVFGYWAYAGNGYEITGRRCGTLKNLAQGND